MDQGVINIVIEQMDNVQAEHSGLELVRDTDGRLCVRGPVGFAMDYEGHAIEDTYEIEIVIPDDFPDAPPTVKETAGAIPADFHQFKSSGTLCLGAPVDVRRRFAQHRTLIGFINGQVIPYLYSYSCYRDHGVLPHGELDHGSSGLLDYYMEHFGATGLTTLKLLKCLADGFAPPLGPCPCGSGRKLRDCHGPKLDELRPHYQPELFEFELRQMINAARAADIDLPDQDVMPTRMWRQKQSRLRKEANAGKRKCK
ncbi:MAG: SEC-C metal-binding domain-containing protein [Phycisphaeraceae bacterium]